MGFIFFRIARWLSWEKTPISLCMKMKEWLNMYLLQIPHFLMLPITHLMDTVLTNPQTILCSK